MGTNLTIQSGLPSDSLNYLAITERDTLTGLSNIGTFETWVNNNLASNQDQMCGLILIDIDNMKVLNDVYGHKAGDTVIKEISLCLVSTFSTGSTVSRIGGDEFCVFVPVLKGGETRESLNRTIVQNIKKIRIPGHSDIRISVSVGAVKQHRKIAVFEELVQNAEIALNQAKKNGMNRAEIYDDSVTYTQTNIQSVLFVTQNEQDMDQIQKFFESRFDIVQAESSKEALHIIHQNKQKIALVLTELYTPDIDGFEILDFMRTMDYIKRIPVVFMTPSYIEDVYKNAFSHGVIDVVSKPFDAYSLGSRLNNIIELYQHKNNLEEMTHLQTQKIQKLNERIINSLGTVVEFRDMESGAHIMRVKTFTNIIAREVMENYPEYELTEESIEMITQASPLHDVGKIAISDRILLKPARLTPDEFEIMKTHTIKGYEIIMKIFGDEDEEYKMYCSNIAKYHHEKFDGYGYPEGLVGDDIPLCAQIVSLADVYDALLSKRCYKESFSYEDAFQMIMNGECGVFNPKLMVCFQNLKPVLEEQAELLRD